MKAILFDPDHGTIRIKCPAGHDHYINTKVPNQQNAQWNFNGDFEKPTFSPSINERTGYFVDPNTKGDEEWLKENSYHCHFFVNNGMIQFLNDCSHDLRGKTMELPDITEKCKYCGDSIPVKDDESDDDPYVCCRIEMSEEGYDDAIEWMRKNGDHCKICDKPVNGKFCFTKGIVTCWRCKTAPERTITDDNEQK